MEYYVEHKLVAAVGEGRQRILMERVYYTPAVPGGPGAVDPVVRTEWWGTATVPFTHGGQTGNASLPYLIPAASRAEAFANADTAWNACAEAAVAGLHAQLGGHDKIVRAAAMPAGLLLPKL